MSGVYALMDTLLPFEWLHYTFMKNALIAGLFCSPRCSACWVRWRWITRWRSFRRAGAQRADGIAIGVWCSAGRAR